MQASLEEPKLRTERGKHVPVLATDARLDAMARPAVSISQCAGCAEGFRSTAPHTWQPGCKLFVTPKRRKEAPVENSSTCSTTQQRSQPSGASSATPRYAKPVTGRSRSSRYRPGEQESRSSANSSDCGPPSSTPTRNDSPSKRREGREGDYSPPSARPGVRSHSVPGLCTIRSPSAPSLRSLARSSPGSASGSSQVLKPSSSQSKEKIAFVPERTSTPSPTRTKSKRRSSGGVQTYGQPTSGPEASPSTNPFRLSLSIGAASLEGLEGTSTCTPEEFSRHQQQIGSQVAEITNAPGDITEKFWLLLSENARLENEIHRLRQDNQQLREEQNNLQTQEQRREKIDGLCNEWRRLENEVICLRHHLANQCGNPNIGVDGGEVQTQSEMERAPWLQPQMQVEAFLMEPQMLPQMPLKLQVLPQVQPPAQEQWCNDLPEEFDIHIPVRQSPPPELGMPQFPAWEHPQECAAEVVQLQQEVREENEVPDIFFPSRRLQPLPENEVIYEEFEHDCEQLKPPRNWEQSENMCDVHEGRDKLQPEPQRNRTSKVRELLTEAQQRQEQLLKAGTFAAYAAALR